MILTGKTGRMLCGILVAGVLLLSACAPGGVLTPLPTEKRHPEPPLSRPPLKKPLPEDAPPAASDQAVPERPSPRHLASLQLADQGRRLLQEGRVEEAISVFERALTLNPGHGPYYYYLAEAWKMKGNTAQALEFNRLAALHLDHDAEWRSRVANQQEDILKQP
jgi:tetratricopeptide (TPR) repeat protein